MCIKCFEKLPRFIYSDVEFIEWQDNDICKIGFSLIPDIANKQINKNVMSDEEIKLAKKKPLYLAHDVDVYLYNKEKDDLYTFRIERGYDYDGASINRFLWRIAGSKESIEFKIASLIHDVLCENHDIVDNDRYFASKVFDSLLEVAGVCSFKRWIIFHCVDNYQKFCNWGD